MRKGKRQKTREGRADNDEKVDEYRGGNAGPDDLRDELLPSIPNHIAWQVIAPSFSGTNINTLSLVSPSWREAIHGGWVYGARVRSHSTETFIILLSEGDTCNLRLYPLNGNSVFNLPPIPEGIGFGCKCIPLDGKIYILGGAYLGLKSRCCTMKMFMLDLAGHKQWKQYDMHLIQL